MHRPTLIVMATAALLAFTSAVRAQVVDTVLRYVKA